MSDEVQTPSGESSAVKYVLLAVAVLYVLLSLYLMFDMRGRIAAIEAKDKSQDQAQAQLTSQLEQAESAAKASTSALADKVGMTEQQLADRTKELQRQQRAAESRLAEQQKQQISAVTGEVAGVKSEVGAVKTDVATTKTELEATKARLERAIGDLGVQSGLIARTREDLDYLKKRGDRNYFEFTLAKNQRQAVSTISLELKKADRKKSKYTVNVLADDSRIEKKDKTAGEPVQFYTGKDRQLFELVVFTVDKDRVTGYLSTPKQIAAPVAN